MLGDSPGVRPFCRSSAPRYTLPRELLPSPSSCLIARNGPRPISSGHGQQPPAIRRFAFTHQLQPGDLFGNVVHRDLFASLNGAKGDVVSVVTARVRTARVVDEPRRRLEQDVLPINDRHKGAFVIGKDFQRPVAQDFAASTPVDDDVACIDAFCRKNSSSVNG